MSSSILNLRNQGKISPPSWLVDNLAIEAITGSRAYGCQENDSSDYDIRGVFLPPRGQIFPNSIGLIEGFDSIPRCEHWNESHIKDDGGREFDYDIHSIVKFFSLAEQNNPNQIDLLFLKENLYKVVSPVGRTILDERKLFLSKLAFIRFRGYASNQLYKLRDKKAIGKRKEIVDKFSYDVKFAYHSLRLLDECVQILEDKDLDLCRNSEEYKAIRKGEWSLDRLEKECEERKLAAEKAYTNSSLPSKPDHDKIKDLLLRCLSMHYGNLNRVCPQQDAATQALREIDSILTKVRNLL